MPTTQTGHIHRQTDRPHRQVFYAVVYAFPLLKGIYSRQGYTLRQIAPPQPQAATTSPIYISFFIRLYLPLIQ